MPYTLVVAEKPSAAAKIAYSLAEGEPKKLTGNGVSYFRFKRGKEDIVVVPAVGHLFALFEKKSSGMWSYPTFDVAWKPTYVNRNNYWAKKYFQNIEALAKGADAFVSATDYDREGSVIAYNILRFICGVKDGRRMKFSTLTKSELEEAYDQAAPHLDMPQTEAGLARHELDWLWGINTSRALTLALRSAGGYETLSTGRVQGPTLKILEEREREIAAFKPEPYWELELVGELNGGEITALHEHGSFWKKQEAEETHRKTTGAAAVESVQKQEYDQPPPVPFDLTTLQREAYNLFKYSPKQTLDYAQALYERACISYPRTSSQKLPPKIGYKKIIQELASQPGYRDLCAVLLAREKLCPRQGEKEDPAHPAIYPTGTKPTGVTEQQRKVYDLIVKRFLATFSDAAVRETMKMAIVAGTERFMAEGARTVAANWMELYKPYARFKEVLLPPAKAGDKVKVKSITVNDKETQPPKRLTQATILKEMEKKNLGTKATRAGILQTLYDRGYIKEKTIEVTELGKSVIGALDKHCPDIVSVELTERFEKEMEEIVEGKRNSDGVVNEAKAELIKILADFKKKEKQIGLELITGMRKLIKEQSTIGVCPCGGSLEVRYARGGKRFVGCTGYPKCTQTFSLPHTGALTILGKKCEACGLNIVSIRQSGKRPWHLCVRCGFVNAYGRKPGAAKPEEEAKEAKAVETKATESAAEPVKKAKRRPAARKRTATKKKTDKGMPT